ncbi:MAG: hypothetical protein IPJ65_09545 [Archangiaceae bacterium]|nr:hypothetical protein [Archangiaceae bacterium]
MSDGPPDPNAPPEEDPLELAPRPRAAEAPPPPAPPPAELELNRPRPSAPAQVRSAARAQPLPEERKKLTKSALREGAVEVLLNSFSILREVAEDFRNSDRYFKYKALVLSTWLMLVVTSIGVSCAGASVGNSFGARLIIAGDHVDRAYMVKNDSDDEWQAVQITINGKYYVTAAQLRPYGDISLSPRLMFDETGKEAPANLVVSEIHLSCNEGDTYLLRGGSPQ